MQEIFNYTCTQTIPQVDSEAGFDRTMIRELLKKIFTSVHNQLINTNNDTNQQPTSISINK